MSVSAAMVMRLRERTGAGMMECKKFLLAAEGDMELAITEMRKAGQAKADKKADRVAAEGVVVVARSQNLQQAVMLEINSETDFVARDASFTRFAQEAAETALASGVHTVDDLAQQKARGQTLSIEEARQQLVTSIGEHIKIRRLVRLDAPDGVVGFYLHGARIGVLVALTKADDALGRDIAMHIAASRPLVVKRDEVAPEAIAHEREIFIAQARETGKPQAIIDKMIDGRISKFVDDVSLHGQAFVKNPDTKVGQLLQQQGAEVLSFVRFEVGEGIEKKEDNFVAEVMAQVRDTL